MSAPPVVLDGPTRALRKSPARDSQRLAEVYRAYWPHTVRFIARQVRPVDRHVVEDLAQTTFLQAWPYLDQLSVDDDGAMYRWLSTIARHVVCDHYRTGPVQQRAAELLVAPDAPLWSSARAADVADEPTMIEQRVDLAAAMEQLPADTRQVLRLRVLDDVPINDVPRQLGRGRATVVRHTSAGLAALRVQLAGQADHIRRPSGHLHGQRRPPVGLSLSEYVRQLDNPPPREPTPAARAGVDPATAAMTLRDYGVTRLRSAMRGLAHNTASPYLAGWRQRVVPTLGHLPVRSIDGAAVDRAVNVWIADECGSSTVRNSRAVLARVLEQAVRDGILARNPANELVPRHTAPPDGDTATSIRTSSITHNPAGHPQPGSTLDGQVANPVDQGPPTADDAADLTGSMKLEPADVTDDVTGSLDLDCTEDDDYRAYLDYLDEVSTAVNAVARPETLPLNRADASTARQADQDPVGQEPAARIDHADCCTPDPPGVDSAPDLAPAKTPPVGQDRPAVEETTAAVERARHALARLQQTRADTRERAGDSARTEQLTRWHADDHAAEDEADDRAGELEGIRR